MQQLFLRSMRRGKKTPQEWAVDIWPIFEAQGQRLIKDGKTLATAVENIAELTSTGAGVRGEAAADPQGARDRAGAGRSGGAASDTVAERKRKPAAA